MTLFEAGRLKMGDKVYWKGWKEEHGFHSGILTIGRVDFDGGSSLLIQNTNCDYLRCLPEELSLILPITEALKKTDWALLAKQKLALLHAIGDRDPSRGSLMTLPAEIREKTRETWLLEGLLSFLDAVQDAAHEEGYPVVFLTEEETV